MSEEPQEKQCCCGKNKPAEPLEPTENIEKKPETFAPSCCSARCSSEDKQEPQNGFQRFLAVFETVRARLILAVLSGICVLYSGLGLWEGVIPFDPAWGAILLSGTPLLWGAVVSLWNRHITAEVLVSTAILATIYTNEIFAGGEVAFIMSLGHLLENWTIKRARAGIEKLLQLTPRTARRISGETQEEIIDTAAVRSGDVLRVLPGESIPVDGRILSGDTSIDQQLLTGEPLPVDKSAGDEVFAGTINRFGAFTMQATKVGEDSSLARMIRLVREAEMQKAPMERITDRWASILVPTAILTAVIVGLLTGEILRAVTILVVFCPCSLVLATPTAIVAAIGNAARYGILVRSGAVLELLGKITTIAFDKTGTLTEGKPQLGAVETLSGSSGKRWNEEPLLTLAATVEQYSDHPISKCITEAARAKGLKLSEHCRESRIAPGQGMVGKVDFSSNDKNGEARISTVLLGNEKMLRENGISLDENAKTKAEAHLNEGATLVWIAVDAELCGFISITDSLRAEAAETVRELQKENINVLLLTGDHSQAARSIAEKAGVSEVHSELLPEEKQRIIAEKESRREITAMIGDGINDAPALKTASVGIAMGKIGSDLAVEAADIALIGDDISRIPFLVRLSRRTVKTIIGNICLSMGINFVAIILATTGLITPGIGALVHNAGSLLVVFNASLLLGLRWEKGGK